MQTKKLEMLGDNKTDCDVVVHENGDLTISGDTVCKSQALHLTYWLCEQYDISEHNNSKLLRDLIEAVRNLKSYAEFEEPGFAEVSLKDFRAMHAALAGVECNERND